MRRTVRRVGAVVVLSLGSILAACGGDDDTDGGGEAATTVEQAASAVPPPTAGAGTVSDACALLTDEQVEAATGSPVATTRAGGGQGFATGSCGWELATDTSTAGVADLTVSVKEPGGRAQFDILAGEMPAVPGVGDAAYQQGDSLWAVAGDRLVVVDFSLFEPGRADRVEVAASLAGTVLAASTDS